MIMEQIPESPGRDDPKLLPATCAPEVLVSGDHQLRVTVERSSDDPPVIRITLWPCGGRVG